MSKVAERVVRLRKAQGLSQRDLAQKAGVSFGFVSKIERGERVPTIDTIRALAEALEASPYYLETGDANGDLVYMTHDEREAYDRLTDRPNGREGSTA